MAGISDLIQLLREGSPKQRCQAAAGLRVLGTAARAALPALASALEQDPDECVRRGAVEAIEHIGPTPAIATSLARKLARHDESGYVRCLAGLALLQLAAEAAETVPLLLAALRDRDPFARFPAAFVLGHLRQGLDDVVPVLDEALRHWFELFRHYAARIVMALGPVAGSTREALVAHLNTCRPGEAPREEVMQAVQQTRVVLRALKGLGPASLTALAAAMRHPDRIVAQLLAPGVLAECGQAALPYLTEAAVSDDPGLQQSALLGLHLLGSAAEPALPLLRSLRDQSTDEARRNDLDHAIRHIVASTAS